MVSPYWNTCMERVKNHSDELIFHSQGLRRNAANLEIASENSPSRNSPRVSSRKALRHEGKSALPEIYRKRQEFGFVVLLMQSVIGPVLLTHFVPHKV